MPSTKEYLGYILDCLSDIEGITYRPMMGEYLIYYNGKYVGGVCDDSFLVKCFKSADILRMLPVSFPTREQRKCSLLKIQRTRTFLQGL